MTASPDADVPRVNTAIHYPFSLMSRNPILITCSKGIPPFLRKEIISLGLPVISENIASVETEGTIDDCLRLNLFVRTGQRVLFLLSQFSAGNADNLYQELSAVRWEEFIPEDGYVCVTVSVENATIRDTRYAALKCKDAVVDRIKKKIGRRPDAGPERNRTVVHLYWKDERCNVYLDTSGEPLSRRGYRKIPLNAPMQETLAAAVVQATAWDGGSIFINPMCGSGTIAIEAALTGLNRAPGLMRDNFGFMHLKGYDEAAWTLTYEKARLVSRKSLSSRIIASDIDPTAVEAARKNATIAGVEHLIEFYVCDFSDTPVPEGGGVIVMNPEYGERMGDLGKLEVKYGNIGDFLKQKCKGYTGYVFTGNPLLAKRVKLKPQQSWQFYNSNIKCNLFEYDLYEGSKKIKKQNLPSP
jgi:23S rRNA G2445 N2-methylase RlmL